jgi:serine/threonine-protein kinase
MGEDGPSDLINGRYALQEVLGEGAYGVVWRALDTRDGGRAVALKLLKADVASGPEGLLRFHNEALALAALEHPNVVRLLDRGSWQGRRYLVLELVPGSTLRARLDRGEAPTLDQARSLHEQVCAGVAAAHAVRDPGAIVHRDLKPANILLGHSDDGALVVKVTDFGLARLGERQYTHTGAHIGTPDYMAPEQATGQVDRIGPWTDVFALGVLLVELLTGRRTAGGTEPWWALSLRAEGSVRGRLGSMRVDVPSSVWDVVAGALRQDPRARPADAEALRTALQAAWVGQAPPELVPAKLPRAPRRRALLVTLAGLAAVSVVLSAVFVRGRLGRSTARAAVPTGTRGPCPEGMLWVRGAFSWARPAAPGRPSSTRSGW